MSAIAQLLANRVVMLSPDCALFVLTLLYSSKRTAVVPTGIIALFAEVR